MTLFSSSGGAAQAAELAVRLQRGVFNRALAEGDLAAIGPLLARDVVLVTGTDSAVLAGRKAQLAAWKREFSAARRTIYVRTPGSIAVSGVEPIALEQGEWQGVEAASGAVEAQGRYCAKWRQVDGQWVIIAEIFVTMA